MTITAGAHSSQPSLRSARAPSDSRGRRRRPVTSGSAVVTVSVVIGPFPFSAFRPRWLAGAPGPSGRSWDQPLRLERVVDLAFHRLLGAHRLDARGRGHQVRDDDGDVLVRRGLPAGAGL